MSTANTIVAGVCVAWWRVGLVLFIPQPVVLLALGEACLWRSEHVSPRSGGASQTWVFLDRIMRLIPVDNLGSSESGTTVVQPRAVVHSSNLSKQCLVTRAKTSYQKQWLC